MNRPAETLRGGYTTGACAAAAAKAAVLRLAGRDPGPQVAITLPDGERVAFAIDRCHAGRDAATAVVVKDAGDDPDVTHGAHVTVTARWRDDGAIGFAAGPGVGRVTLPGLQVAPGEPAINPGPRRLIAAAVREVTGRGVTVEVAVPEGAALAARTFNQRLGVEGGLSILGTTGRVKPYSCEAVRESLKCALRIAGALGVRAPVLVPGNIGERAAAAGFSLGDHQVVQAGNDWGMMLDELAAGPFTEVLALGHPGKLAKLAAGHWDTHSSRSPAATAYLAELAGTVLGRAPAPATTAEGLLRDLAAADRERLCGVVAAQVRAAIARRLGWAEDRVAVVLVDMANNRLGQAGGLGPWKERPA